MQNSPLAVNKRLIYLTLILAVCFTACSPNKIISRKVSKEFKNSAIVHQYHAGFALYDMDAKEMIFEKDAHTYYTPASNTKLFTFYAGLKMAPDSIPSLRYVERGDSLIFWGTGDPSFLQTKLKGTKAFDFLKNSNKKLFFSAGRYTGDFYGNGWQWDDYNDYYQPEINELPLIDNVVLVSSTKPGEMNVLPQSFQSCFVKDSTLNSKPFKVIRDYNSNLFKIPSSPIPDKINQQIPYKVSTAQTINLLIDTLNKFVGVSDLKMPADAKTIFNLKSDSVFKEMLLPSDNFIAEHLLLTYADRAGIELNTSKIISYIEKQYLSSLPDKIRWVDGSGLSRGNLFTPRDMIALLELIYHEVKDEKRLFDLLPAGGKSGTLRNAYPKTDTPFVFGKTGSLSNNHNQSGYVVTKKGRVLLFSFMNNNFVLPTADVRKEMVRIMTYIHENF
jgi:D-alanyl-D-alanine carboxypeptidase/D-alanyl-D-alanine-endopeptidase (penicillin-binding protein 4)